MSYSKYIIYFLVIVLLSQSWFLPGVAQEADEVDALFNKLTVEEKIGQLFIVPFVGTDTSPGSDIDILITEYKIGGVVLQASNSNFSNHRETPAEIANLVNQLQTKITATQNIPLFIAVDHEGDGWPYSRITGGVTPIPNAMSIGATWDTENALDVGRIVGRELSSMGINMLLGPVLDVLNEPRPTGRGDVGTRTFGGDPFWVGEMGEAYIAGIHEGSNNTIVTVAKHFPGHGGSDRLPDNEIATVDKSLQELKRIELAPFFAVAKLDSSGTTDVMMSSHIRYRGFQGDIRQFTAPISFDEVGMSMLLRLSEFAEWRNAGGLIMSDALGVLAVRKYYDPTLQTFPHRRVAREAFLAGNDLLILGQFDLNSIWSQQFKNIKDTAEFFQAEYRTNKDFARRVDQSVKRVLRLKLKRFPSNPDELMVDVEKALTISGQERDVAVRIAQQSLTLLHPTPEEYKLRLPRPPGFNDKILFVTDTRSVRECYDNTCQPFEPLPYNAMENMILALYGPQATGQIQPENLASITFTELKRVMSGSLIPDPPEPEEADTSEIPESEQPQQPEQPETTPPIEETVYTETEIATLIQNADWIIFLTLDLNVDRYPTSDALKLFLAQGLSSLYDKNLIVFAMNGPYYLDTTEVNKLSAYFAVYSKTWPHIEVATRALFGEVSPQAASPVNVEGIRYDLASILSPDPIRSFNVKVQSITPDDHQPPVSVMVEIGPILDHNGHAVPDGTPIEFELTYNDGHTVSVPPISTYKGMAQTTLTLTDPGSVEIFAYSGAARSQRPQFVTVAPLPDTPTPTATNTATPTPTGTASPTPKPATATQTPILTATQTAQATPLPSATVETKPTSSAAEPYRKVSGFDFLVALISIALVSVGGNILWLETPAKITDQSRMVLTAFIGGMLGYLLYGLGWLRPDSWLGLTGSLFMQRIVLALIVLGLSFLGSFFVGRGHKAAK